MRLAFGGPVLRTLGAPAAVKRCRGEPLACLAAEAAPRSLRSVALPPAYRRPPVLLIRAGVYDDLVKLDYNHLYARIAADVLSEYGYAEEAAWFRRLVRLREETPRELMERFVIVDAGSEFAEMWTLGVERCSRSSRCRRVLVEAAGDPPLTRSEAVELLKRLSRYRLSAVPVKALVKYLPHVVVGMSRNWRTGLWENVVDRSVDAAREMLRGCRAAAYIVDAVIAVDGCKPKTRYPYKVDARGPGFVAVPGLYVVGEEKGYWGVWDEEPVLPVVEGGVVLGVEYVGAERCLSGGPCRRLGVVKKAAKKLGVVIGATLRDIRDTIPGVVREWVIDTPHRWLRRAARLV